LAEAAAELTKMMVLAAALVVAVQTEMVVALSLLVALELQTKGTPVVVEITEALQLTPPVVVEEALEVLVEPQLLEIQMWLAMEVLVFLAQW
jgi:hypothetical protein